jgi:4-aminobutyrate aminotransferase
MMIGIELVHESDGEPDAGLAGRIVVGALAEGVLILSGGVASNVISLSPPLTVDRDQLDAGVSIVERLLVDEDATQVDGR